MQEKIVVTGVGVTSPLGIGNQDHWENAAAGKTGIKSITRFDTQALPCGHAGEVADFDPKAWLPKKGLRNLNRSIIFARVAAKLALKDAHLSEEQLNPSTIAVMLGTNGACTAHLLQFHRDASSGFADPLLFPNTGISAPACQISIFEGYHDQTSTLSSGHAASLEAISVGANALRQGGSEVVIAGGVEELCLETFAAACHMGTFFTNGMGGDFHWPGPFSSHGTVAGEGSACLILERESHAQVRQANILAEIAGEGIGFDPDAFRKKTARVELMLAVMEEALRNSDLKPEQVDCVLSGAHGDTIADRAEAAAITRLFGKRGVPVIAVSSQLGDTYGAAGAFQAVAAVMAIRQQCLAGCAPCQNGDLDLVNGSRECKVHNCLLTSFGSTGDRMALVVRNSS